MSAIFDAADAAGGDAAATNEVEQPPMKAAVAEDHAFISEFVAKAATLSLTRDILTVVVVRTPYARVQLRIMYTPRYPDEAPIVELTSPTLPMMLLRNKEKECVDKCKESHLGKPQAHVIYALVHGFIQTNLFVPCWKEVRAVMALVEGKGQIGADDKAGVLHLRLQSGEYRQSIKIRVPPTYPEEGVCLEFFSSSFSPDLVYMFSSQAAEIVRRCEAGFSPELALSGSNPIELPTSSSGTGGKPGKASDAVSARAMTSGNLKALKHDIGVLKQISDLRVASQSHSKAQYVTQGNAERREARKDLRRLARAESEKDEEEERIAREQEQQEMLALMRLKVSDVAQPSLLPVARFLIDDYAMRLPAEKCQACLKSVLANDPASESLTNPRSSRRPMRTFCGHWLHWNCLDTWLTTPPFVRQCPQCDRRIWHPDWPADHKQLEKAWQMKEARDRECNDCADFLGL